MKPLRKITIEFEADILPDIALRLAREHVLDGRISESRGVPKLCHLIVRGEYESYARDRRFEHSGDSLVIRRLAKKGGDK